MAEVVDRPYPEASSAALIRAGLHPILARVYAARGIAAPDQLDTSLRRLLAPIGWEALWSGVAARRGLEVARGLDTAGTSPGVVIATSPSHSALLAGERISRQLGWPLILDYRDPWSAHDWPRWRRSALAQWFSRRIEARLLGDPQPGTQTRSS